MKKLTPTELAHYIGAPCFFANAADVVKGQISFRMLQYQDDDSNVQIVPVLRPLESMTESELHEWSNQPYFVDGFSKDCANKITSGLFNFHMFVSEWGASECYLWLMQKGFDVFGWLDSKRAMRKDVYDKLYPVYSSEAFADVLRMI